MIGVPKRIASMHSREKRARRQVDADAGMGEEAPQVHPGVDGDLPSQGPASPGRCDRILDDDHVRVVEAGLSHAAAGGGSTWVPARSLKTRR